MTSIVFDTLLFAKQLEKANFTRAQAEGLAEELAKVIDDQLATKRDIKILQKDIKELEYKLTIRLGAMISAGIAILATLMTILHILK